MLNRVWNWLKTPRGKDSWRPGWVILYLFAAFGLLAKLGDYYVPDYGFTYLIGQGDEPAREFNWIEERDVTVYRHFRSSGYDAQYYAQLALDPALLDPTLNRWIIYHIVRGGFYCRGRHTYLAWGSLIGSSMSTLCRILSAGFCSDGCCYAGFPRPVSIGSLGGWASCFHMASGSVPSSHWLMVRVYCCWPWPSVGSNKDIAGGLRLSWRWVVWPRKRTYSGPRCSHRIDGKILMDGSDA